MLVMREMTLAIRSTSTSASFSCLISVQVFLCSRSFERRSFSLSRKRAAFSNSCCWMAASFSLATSSTCFSSSRTSVGMAEMLSLALAPASSITSIALSGKKRSLM